MVLCKDCEHYKGNYQCGMRAYKDCVTGEESYLGCYGLIKEKNGELDCEKFEEKTNGDQ